MSAQTYYVPEQSRFPIFMALSLFLLVMGASSTINNLDNPDSNSAYILYAGFISLFTTLFFWFRQVIKEHLAGLDSNQLKTSYVYGMAWFIFSEVMFFAAFFGALFYVRNFAVPWLGGEGENGVGVAALDLWDGFESAWPLIETPDKGAVYKDIGFTSMAWPGWDKALKWLPLWNTIVLLSSSVTVHFAHIGLKNGDRKKFHRFLGITVCLALIFVGLQAAEYYEAYAHYGLTLNSGIYGSTFFMLTGFHGFHVMMGGLMLAVMLARSVFAGHFEDHDHFGFEAASWYWHFVDVVWVMLFLFVYIL
jgi:cytochrome c oxidase subunit 3